MDIGAPRLMISLKTTRPGLVTPLAEPNCERMVGGSEDSCLPGGKESVYISLKRNPEECYLL